MMLDWNGYRKQVGAGVTELARLSPETARGYRMLGDAGQKTGHLDAKTRALDAYAARVAEGQP